MYRDRGVISHMVLWAGGGHVQRLVWVPPAARRDGTGRGSLRWRWCHLPGSGFRSKPRAARRLPVHVGWAPWRKARFFTPSFSKYPAMVRSAMPVARLGGNGLKPPTPFRLCHCWIGIARVGGDAIGPLRQIIQPLLPVNLDDAVMDSEMLRGQPGKYIAQRPFCLLLLRSLLHQTWKHRSSSHSWEYLSGAWWGVRGKKKKASFLQEKKKRRLLPQTSLAMSSRGSNSGDELW